MVDSRENNGFGSSARERLAQRKRRRYTDHSQFGGPVSERDEVQPVQGDYRRASSARASQYDRRNYVSKSQFSRRPQADSYNQSQAAYSYSRKVVHDQNRHSRQYEQGSMQAPVYDMNENPHAYTRQPRAQKQNNPRVIKILAIVAAALFAVILVRVVIALPAMNEYFTLNNSNTQKEQVLAEENAKNQEVQDQINSWQKTIDEYNKKKK